jgi:hypothetical protein
LRSPSPSDGFANGIGAKRNRVAAARRRGRIDEKGDQ